MQINVTTTTDGNVNVALEGRLDTLTAPELEDFVNNSYDGEGVLTINCEKLVYLSSAGLRILLVAHKKSGGRMKLTKVCELVMEVIQMTGFYDILEIE